MANESNRSGHADPQLPELEQSGAGTSAKEEFGLHVESNLTGSNPENPPDQ